MMDDGDDDWTWRGGAGGWWQTVGWLSAALLLGAASVGCDRPATVDDEKPAPEIEETAGQDGEIDVPQGASYALRGVTVVDGTGGEPMEEATVVVDGGRFAAVGPTGEVDVGDTEAVDLTDHTITPALIDSHVHLGPLVVGHDQERGGEDDVPPETPTRDIVDISTQFVDRGVTTVKSVGDPFPWIIEARQAIDAEGADTPRVVAAGPLFTAPGGHPSATIYEANPWLRDDASALVDTAEQARRTVQEVSDGGADLIKIVYDDGGGRFVRLDDQAMEAIVDEANQRDLVVTAHVGSDEEARRVVDAGVDGIEHARPFSDETIAKMAAEDIFFVPTLSVYDSLAGAVPKNFEDSVRRAADAGVDVVAGSDVGNPGLTPGASTHRELRLLVDAGLTPQQAITAATHDAARFLGMDGEIGVIADGARADFIVVDADPIADLDALADPLWVVRDGVVQTR